MSTVTKGTAGTQTRKPLATGKNAASEAARKTAQAQWAMEQLAGATDKVVVVPVFEKVGKDWVPSDTVIRTGNNPAWGAIMLMGTFTGSSNSRAMSRKFAGENGNNTPVSCLKPVSEKNFGLYTGGQLLTGRIDTEYTTVAPNKANWEQDIYFINADARSNNLPACDADGGFIYAVRYWEDDLNQPKPAMIEVANREDILAQIAEING